MCSFFQPDLRCMGVWKSCDLPYMSMWIPRTCPATAGRLVPECVVRLVPEATHSSKPCAQGVAQARAKAAERVRLSEKDKRQGARLSR